MGGSLYLVGFGMLALVPGLAWLYAFYRLDRYEPEPAALLLRTFALGGLALAPAILLEVAGLRALFGPEVSRYLVDLTGEQRTLALFVVVAPVEELLKLLAAWVSMGRHAEFDEPMDGVVYMAAAGLGFSTAENLYYLCQLTPTTMLLRGVFSCFLHASCSGLIGFWWSEVKFHGRSRLTLAAAVAAAVVVHGLFDQVAFSQYRSPFLVLAFFLVVLDAALMARVGQALERSPFRPPEED